MLNRLRAVEWIGDWDNAFGHVMSRRVLMREYLRRAALWAKAYSVETAWPFFDATQYVDPGFQLSPGLSAQLDELLLTVPGEFLQSTSAGAVRMAELQAQKPAMLPALPDLYEPLVLFYERGGEFVQDNGGGIDLTGVSFRPGRLEDNLHTPPFNALNETVLDALDAKGRISFYSGGEGPWPLLRRRKWRDEQHDEVFSEELRWEPTDLLPATEEEVKGAGYVRIGDVEAAEPHRDSCGGPLPVAE